MKKNFTKMVLAICFFAISTSFVKADVYATESQDISDIATRQSERENPGQVYLNEPLDNAVPVIYKYEVEGDGYIVPGESFKIKFTVYNPAVVSKVGNIRIMAYDDQNRIYPGYGNINSIYMGYLDPLSYTDGEMELIASKDITDKEIAVNLVMSYTDNYRTDNSQKFIAVLPVLKAGKLNVEKVDLPSAMHVGANNRLSLTYRNNGLSTINDVTLHVKGANITEKKVDLGSVGSGTSITSDAYIDVLKEGDQSIEVNFTYTDNAGKTYETEVQTYNVAVASYDEAGKADEANTITKRNQINNIATYGILLVSCLILLIIFIKSNIFKRIKMLKTKGDKK